MDLSLFHQKDLFPRFVTDKLTKVTVDYEEKYTSIKDANQTGSFYRQAGVVLLLNYKSNQEKPEYVFQLIKRSDKVSQAGDISCPGGMLHPRLDNILSHFLKLGILSMPGEKIRLTQSKDKETNYLIRLFLTTALREAWEEVGLNPFNVLFLGALPSYSLTLFARTIFPLACVTPKHFTYKLSPEVEKVLEIPLSFFFDSTNYAILNIKTSPKNDSASMKYNCIVIPDGQGGEDILWGATLKIIDNFLRIVSDDSLPSFATSRIITKVLTTNYMSSKS
ncbi:MAG: coenzyme A pyrophosphatase [Smithella sp.]|jgi:8-oxo-dGTP pyrophosphatase MutT (NUDIX family)